MVTVGLDPGVTGAIAELRDGRVEGVYSMPVFRVNGKNRVDEDGLARILRTIAPAHAFVELVGSRPGEGHAGAFAFGRSAGVIAGALAGLGIARTLVAPVTWKMALRVPADKDAARQRASQLFPGSAHLWPLVKDDGKAEAALIALWGHLKGGVSLVAENSIQW